MRLYKYKPWEIDKLYADYEDHWGLFFWYEDAKEYIKQINDSLGALQ